MRKLIIVLVLCLTSFGAKAQHVLNRYAVGAGYNIHTREVVLTASLKNALLETQFSTNTLYTLVGWEIPFRKDNSWNYFSVTPKAGFSSQSYDSKPLSGGSYALNGTDYYFNFGLNLNYTYKWMRISSLLTIGVEYYMLGLTVSVNIH